MKKSWLSLRGIFSLLLSASLVTVSAAPAFSGDGPFPGSRRVTSGKLLPPGIPVPGGPVPGIPVPGVNVPVPGIPVPVPAPPVVVERHRPPVVVERHREYYSYREHPKHRAKWSHKRKHHHGRVYRTLPADVFTFTLGGGMFYYHFGTYYRHTGEGYVVVEAPVGARVRVLPDDCSVFADHGRRYYACDDIYYEAVDGEYIVIDGPPPGYRWEAEIGEQVWIKADSLNVRSGPGTRYRTIGRLYRRDVVEVSGMEGSWYSVRLQDGSYGWISKDHARLYRRELP